MNSIKIYNKQDKILFNKNKFFCFIYKYEKDIILMYSINMNENRSKFHSIFECIITKKDEDIILSMSQDRIEYEIKTTRGEIQEIEKGRVPFKDKKKKWSNKSIKSGDVKLLEIDNFDGVQNLIYKVNDEFLNKLIKIKDGKTRSEKRDGN